MALDKYAQLKIAGNVLVFTMKDFADQNNTSVQVIREVCFGHTTSARLIKAVNEKIAESNKILDDHRHNEKLQQATA